MEKKVINPHKIIAISIIAEHFFPAPLPYGNYFLSSGSVGYHTDLFYKTAKIVERAEKTIKNILNNIIKRKIIHGSIKPLPNSSGLFFVNKTRFEEERKKVLENIRKLVFKNDLRKVIQDISNKRDLSNIRSERNKIIRELKSIYMKHQKDEDRKLEMNKIIIQFFSPFLDINPYEIKIENFIRPFFDFKTSEMKQLKELAVYSEELNKFYKKLDEHELEIRLEYCQRRVNEDNLVNLIKDIKTYQEIQKIYNLRQMFLNAFEWIFDKLSNNKEAKDSMIKLFIQFYSSHLNINQYEINIKNYISVFNNLKSDEIKQRKKFVS